MANILSVSRPHLSKLLKSGEIPFILVGAHRRAMHADLTAYIDPHPHSLMSRPMLEGDSHDSRAQSRGRGWDGWRRADAY